MLIVLVLIKTVYAKQKERDAIIKMCNIIFPDGELQQEDVMDNINDLTKGRFDRTDLLDYYLKIKGLQMLDLHAHSDKDIRKYLMKPTRIRLNYYEQVLFYERFLNYPQAEGINAVKK